MKRIVFFVAVLTAALGMSGARAATVQQISNRSVDVQYSLVPNGFCTSACTSRLQQPSAGAR